MPVHLRQNRQSQEGAIADNREVKTRELIRRQRPHLVVRHRRRMHDQGLQYGGKMFNLSSPVGQQRSRSHQKTRLFCSIILPLHQKQGQNLDGFPKTHVVGKAGSKPESTQQVHPFHTRLLIGTECAFQGWTGIESSTAGAAQGFQCLGQPRPSSHLRPVGSGDIGTAVGECGTGQHAHGFGESQATLRRQFFSLLELSHGLFHAVAINFHPLAAQQDQRISTDQEHGNLFIIQRLTLQHHLHAEIEQPVETYRRGRLCANNGGDLWSWRTIGAPSGGHAYHHTSGFKVRHAGKKLRGFAGTPAQGVEDLSRINHPLQPTAAFGGPLHWHQQRQEFVAVSHAGIFAQGLSEWYMLGLGIG